MNKKIRFSPQFSRPSPCSLQFSPYIRGVLNTIQAGMTADNIVASAFFMPIRQLAEPISIA